MTITHTHIYIYITYIVTLSRDDMFRSNKRKKTVQIVVCIHIIYVLIFLKFLVAVCWLVYVDFAFLFSNGERFIHVILEINWRRHMRYRTPNRLYSSVITRITIWSPCRKKKYFFCRLQLPSVVWPVSSRLFCHNGRHILLSHERPLWFVIKWTFSTNN